MAMSKLKSMDISEPKPPSFFGLIVISAQLMNLVFAFILPIMANHGTDLITPKVGIFF
jgi:hypothetical protein